MSTHTDDRCNKPKAKRRRNRNRIWVCDCGKAYVSKRYTTRWLGDPYWAWLEVKIKPVYKLKDGRIVKQ